MAPKFQKGSQWRKWDLHIHAPTAVFNNQFSGKDEDEKWENYFKELEKLTDISVLGITDYWSIDGYKRVKEYKDAGNLKNIDLILPNVELRISEGNNGNKAINLHCIFNPSIADRLDDDFFAKLEFSYKDKSYSCTKSNLIQLGKKIENKIITDEQAYESGCKQFKASLVNINNILKNNNEISDNIFIVVANSNKDGASIIKDNNLQALREEIYRASDAIFSGNPQDRNYFLGKGADDKETIIKKYGSLKPCIHGSDAHQNDKICKPNEDRFTWIKADPTFEGLKQIIYEPKDRVHIGIEIPYKLIDQTIHSIKIQHDNFPTEEVLFNKNLISIIGSRSSGKSLLLHHIAKTINHEEVKKRYDDMDKKLPYEDKPKHERDIDFSKFDLTVLWCDGSESRLFDAGNKKLSNDLDEDTENKNHNMIYIPQGYLHFTAEKNQEAVKEIILSFLEQNDDFNAIQNQFKADKEKNYSEIVQNVNNIFNVIKTAKNLKSQITAIGSKNGIENNIKNLQEKITTTSKRLNISSKEIQEKERIEKTISELKVKQKNIKSDEICVKNLENFNEMINKNFINQNIMLLQPTTQDLLKNQIEGLVNEFENSVKAQIKVVNKRLKEEYDQTVSNINTQEEALKPLTEKFKEQLELQNMQNILNAETKKFLEIAQLEKKLKDFTKQYNELKNTLVPLMVKRIQIYLNFIKSANDKIETINKDGISINVDFVFEKENFCTDFKEKINKTKHKDCEKELRFDELSNSFDEKKYEDFCTKISGYINRILINNDEKIYLNTGNRDDLEVKKECVDTILKNFFGEVYNVEYENDTIEYMSSGKRSIFLLKLIIELSENNYPILIDQPEDDLDNSSIYSLIVNFIKNKKKQRQIILVTHNPNLVIGTDTEQVIKAEQIVNAKKTFSYNAGSIEDPDIKKQICQILEGGETAFKNREKRYGLQ